MTTEHKTNIVKVMTTDLARFSRGFICLEIDTFNADAIVRGHKSDIVFSSSKNIQKGDYIVLLTNLLSHPINSMVFEAAFVTAIPFSADSDGFSQCAISIAPVPNASYHRPPHEAPYFLLKK